jgi:hypothetical protein
MRLTPWKAFWTARQLRAAKDAGLKCRTQIARSAFERQYLTEHLCYELGPSQKRAISLFADMLLQAGRISVNPPLKYV